EAPRETRPFGRPIVRRTTAGRSLLVIGSIGVVVSLLAIVVGLCALGEVGSALDGSMSVTGDALRSLDASVQVASDSLDLLDRGLAGTEATTRDLVTSFDDAERLLGSTA